MQPSEVRQYTIAVNAPQPLRPGVRTDIAVMPQTDFKPERLVLGDECQDATIHQIRVGSQDSLVGDLPGALLTPTAPKMDLFYPVAHPGDQIVLTVSRPQGGTFSGAFIGASTGVPFKEPLVEEAEKAVAAMRAEEAEAAGLVMKLPRDRGRLVVPGDPDFVMPRRGRS